MTGRVAQPFPEPSGRIKRSLELLAVVRRHDEKEMAARQEDLTDLARPWEPADCPAEMRTALWQWCEQVAAWLNHEYCWRPEHLIPACWPAHPHIARELAVLAVLRWQAREATDPAGTEEWQRNTYPQFCQRMAARLGESTCRTGRHTDWPAAPRHAAYHDPAAAAARQAWIGGDAAPAGT